MKSTIQKRLAAKIAKRSRKKVIIDESRRDEIKEAITRADVRALMKDGAITVKKNKGISRGRAKEHQKQKSKGRRKGQGSRKGSANARGSSKKKWMNKIRLQRKFLKELKDAKMLEQEAYKGLYKKAKGGFFRSRRHIKLYITEHRLIKAKK
ncbi:TPA: 50S ribosomal protein L19e [Candidatus Woesearchaeota archaeon]|nr:50S ribosomal protein L19e [archaeon GW2011_AR15]MBS3103847.1 50S ribosomal protein L19e [Candidatus Woesearchaeota archaeon]HIH40827.1 50S ribosomal protein L19e [Candidatus Woesearchaeota archaeon]